MRCERILQQCDDPHGGRFSGGRNLAELKQDALQVIEELQTQHRPARVKPAVARRSLASTVLRGVALAAMLLVAAGNAQAASEPAHLTAPQQQTLLAEANEIYGKALSAAGSDSAEAKQGFDDAAEKYQLVVDSGVRNSRLYFNLGNAYLESGTTGRAIANYRRSLRLDPTNGACRDNLAYAETLVASKSPPSEASHASHSISGYASLANGWFNRYVSPRNVLVSAILAWLVVWAAIGARLLGVRYAWKSVTVVALGIAAMTATSYSLSCQAAARDEAVVVSADATLRAGDGENFPTVAEAKLSAGESVAWLKRRGDWIQVRTDDGQTGWLLAAAVETL